MYENHKNQLIIRVYSPNILTKTKGKDAHTWFFFLNHLPISLNTLFQNMQWTSQHFV